VKFLMDFHKRDHMVEEVEYLYEENKYGKERLEEIKPIGEDVTYEITDDETDEPE
jgi:hypothetical protein